MLGNFKDQENLNTAELIDRYMRDLNADENVVQACLKQAGEADLKGYGFDYYLINLLACFKGRISHEQIRDLAARATVAKLWGGWEYFSYVTNLPEKAATDVRTNGTPVRLKGWDMDLIRRLMDRGKGLIVCSHHFGAYRYLQTDLAFLGLKLVIPLNEESYLQTVGSLKLARAALQRCPDADPGLERMLDAIKPVNVEEKGGTAEILKALECGEVVLIFTDGNTGTDGPLGKTSRSEIDFFNFRIAIKNGVARMSAAMDAPLLPVLALAREETGQVVFGEPIIPPVESSDDAERDGFVQNTMQTLYQFLEHYARKDPEQWQSSCFLHRWRFAAQPSGSATADISVERDEVIRLLEYGAFLKLDGNRAAIVDTKEGGRVLVDVEMLKFYSNIKWAEDLLRVLFEPAGLDRGWMNSQGADGMRKEKYLNLLAHFKSTDLLQWASL